MSGTLLGIYNMIENHELREELLVNVSPDQINYSNARVGSLVTNVSDALNYLFASLYPNYIGTYATPGVLPVSAADNSYAFVTDDGDGHSAGYVYTTLDGVAGWSKKYDVDWSVDSLLSSFISETHPLYVFINGRENGQTIYGGIATGENLELNANSLDGTGKIITANTLEPKTDTAIDLGEAAKRFKDLYLTGNITDGTITISMTDLLDFYNHMSDVSNPHATGYSQLTDNIGTVTVDGDVSGSVDLSTPGDKTLTITVADDSHAHTKSTLTGFDTNVYSKIKSILQNADGITFTANDGLETITPAQADISTSEITNIDDPASNKILASNAAGNNWAATTLTTELTGDVSGSANFSSTTGKVSITTTVDNVEMANVNGINLNNVTVAIGTGVGTVTVTLVAHQLVTGDKVYLDSSIIGVVVPQIKAEFTITKTGNDTFTIPTTVTVGGNAYMIVNHSQLLYNSTTQQWEVQREFAELTHSEILLPDLNDDHLQYARVAGRSGGQTIQGGTSSLESLVLESTADVTKGKIKFKDTAVPFANATYGGSWSGVDLGTSTFKFRNIYLAGEAFGLRPENVTSNPSSSGQNLGRIVYHTVEDKYYYDNGTQFKPLSSANVPTIIVTMSSNTTKLVDLTSVLDVGKTTSDYIWMLFDSTTSDQFHPSIARTSTTSVTITSEIALTGTFSLKGI